MSDQSTDTDPEVTITTDDLGEVSPAPAAPQPEVPAEAAAPSEPVEPAGEAPEPANEPANEAPEATASDLAEPDPTEPEATASGTAEAEPTEATASGTAEPGAEPEAVAATPQPRAPRPGGRPGPRPAPKPSARGGRKAGGRPAAGPVTRPPSDPSGWGRMTEDGTVLVRTATGERAVGTVVDATEEAALAHFGREYDALVATVDLQEQRLIAGEVPPTEVVGALRALRSSLAEVSAVGDLEGLSQRTRDLEALAAVRREEIDAARASAREESLTARTALVDEAEQLAATDPQKVQWRPAGDRLRELLDAWKEAQRSSRLDKRTEDELWKRFSAARTSFDRARRAWFAQLEQTSSSAKAAKETLVAEAEALSTSTEWGPTSTAYRHLMDRWKAAGRASRKDDDALWARFRTAQDTFFTARTSANAEEDTEQQANLLVKEALLTEAEALLPISDLRSARAGLRGIQERWDAAGRVPRADLQRVEGRLRTVESAINDADKDRWRKSNPETHARAQGAVEQLERAVAGLELDLTAARERGDARAEADALASLEARRAWLAAAQRTASEFSG